ncbi:MAG: hypothetical protein RBU21_14045, partial [FCB group bacterium]|nr:hypothetical protein [FCB group bacterium]
MPQHVFMGLCTIGTGFLFIAMNLPFALGKVRPNRFYCIPAAAFFRSNEEAWYDISRYGGRKALLWTFPLFLLGVLLLILPLDPWLANKWTNLALAAGPPTHCYNLPVIQTNHYAWRKRKSKMAT